MSLRELQYSFTAHIRDPERNPAPADVEDRRMKIYRELLYNNVESFIAAGFPVLRKLLDEAHWHAMVRDFFASHRCRTPFFHRIAAEFLEYLQHERGSVEGDPPFLLELAHYEWVELALSISEEEISLDGVDRDGDLLTGRPVLSPLAWHLAYRFPVHRIGPDFRPQTPGDTPTCLVVYRAQQDDRVAFLEINPATSRLLKWLSDEPHQTGKALLKRLAEELGHPDPQVVETGGNELLRDFRRRGIILGTRSA